MDQAVAAARRAFDTGPWPRMPASERGRYLLRIAAILEGARDEVARLESANNGKPIRESSQIDVPLSVDCFEYFAGFATKIHGETLPVPGDVLSYTVREPLGVVGAITPFNFPLLLATWKIAPALAAGNTVVIKPASDTPLTTLRLGEIALEAGLPPGVLNVVVGDSSIGNHLVEHPDVDKITFTGSTEVGKQIAAKAAGNLKRVSLELGGKAPNIVFADAPLDDAVAGALFGVFWTQGEICTAGSRLFVQRPIFDAFVERFTARARGLRVGHPLDPRTQIGPMVSATHRDRVMAHIRAGREAGARLMVGGGAPEDAALARGHYVNPTVFVDVRPGDDDRARGDLRSGGLDHGLRHAGGCRPAGQRHEVRSDRRRLDPRREARPPHGPGHPGRDHLGEHVQRRDQRGAVRWLQGERLGTRERSPRDRRLHRGQARLRQPRRAQRRLVRGRRMTAAVLSDGRVLSPLGRRVAELHLPPIVHFGQGALAVLGVEARGFGDRALLVTDRGMAATGIVDQVIQVLRAAGVEPVVFDGVEPNPTIAQVEAGLEAGAGREIRLIVSVGGGSAHDCAKVIALVATNGGDVRDFEGLDRSAHRGLPLICVNTTAGSGADVSRYAVITDPARSLKMIIIDRHLMPRVAVNDPLLTLGMPAAVTMASGLDALTHAIEAYVSTLASEVSSLLALRAIALIVADLERAVGNGRDVEAREGMLMGSLLAGMAIDSGERRRRPRDGPPARRRLRPAPRGVQRDPAAARRRVQPGRRRRPVRPRRGRARGWGDGPPAAGVAPLPGRPGRTPARTGRAWRGSCPDPGAVRPSHDRHVHGHESATDDRGGRQPPLRTRPVSDEETAIGMLEVLGLTAAIGAADAMAKAAPVRLAGPFVIGRGLVTIVVRGDIAAVIEAIEAGATVAGRLGHVATRHVIGRPFGDVDAIFGFSTR